ncbi:MAG: protein kinase, partial [Longimicrobiales bacterium]|nr:protein kinase [Longimicrobiales bacterium]
MDDELIQRLKAALPSRYAVEEEIGRGGMAVVYRAEDRKHGRPVALKIVRPELASTIGIDRFLREIEVVARLQHPNVLTLIDSGEADGLPWYVTPYIAGQSLRDLLAREGALPVDRAVEIARGVADALEVAHREEVVHRDIKPGNVLLSGGHPVVSDFGVAAALGEASDGRLTETGVSVGSPVYMSPEQASGEGVIDARTDLYALGCVLYEMLAGRPPFEGPVQAVLTRKFTGEVEPLRALRPEVPDALAAVVERAMAVDPDDRFGSVAALRDALGTARLAAAPSRARVGRPILVAAVLGVTVLVGAVAVIRDVRADAERRQWAAEQIARVEDLADQGRYPEALALAEEVEAAVPGDTALANLLPRISFTVPIRTEPAGARVLIQPMDGPEDAWDTLGITPLPEVRFAGLDFVLRGPGDSYLGYRPSRLRFEREGYRTRELLLTAILGGRWRGMEPLGAIVLVPEDSAPEDMVRIPGFTWGPIEHGPYFL